MTCVNERSYGEQGFGSGRLKGRFRRFRRFRFRFHQDVVILLVIIPPTYLKAAATANRFRFRFQNPAGKANKRVRVLIEWDGAVRVNKKSVAKISFSIFQILKANSDWVVNYVTFPLALSLSPQSALPALLALSFTRSLAPKLVGKCRSWVSQFQAVLYLRLSAHATDLFGFSSFFLRKISFKIKSRLHWLGKKLVHTV